MEMEISELMERAAAEYLRYYGISKSHGRQPRPQVLKLGRRDRDGLVGVVLYDSYQRTSGNPRGDRLLFVLYKNGGQGRILEEKWTWREGWATQDEKENNERDM